MLDLIEVNSHAMMCLVAKSGLQQMLTSKLHRDFDNTTSVMRASMSEETTKCVKITALLQLS